MSRISRDYDRVEGLFLIDNRTTVSNLVTFCGHRDQKCLQFADWMDTWSKEVHNCPDRLSQYLYYIITEYQYRAKNLQF